MLFSLDRGIAKGSLHLAVVKTVHVRVTERVIDIDTLGNLLRVILLQHNGATRCLVNKHTSFLTSKMSSKLHSKHFSLLRLRV